MHQEIPTIDVCGGPNCVQNVIKKSKNITKKLGKPIEV